MEDKQFTTYFLSVLGALAVFTISILILANSLTSEPDEMDRGMASAVAERTKPMANVYVGSVPVAATQAPAAMKVAVELSGENKKMLWIPPGFAHGFATLEDDTVFLYKCTDTYSPEHEGSILWSDESLQIDWKVISPSLSEKDQKGPNFVEFDSPFTYAP